MGEGAEGVRGREGASGKMAASRSSTRMMAKGKKAAAAGTQRMGGAGYKKYDGRTTWLPDIDPAKETPWLDGSLPGDRGFDPLGLSKPQEFLQMDLDALDQNKAINKPG